MSSILFSVNALSQKVCLNDDHNASFLLIFGNGTRENDTIIYGDSER